MPNNDHCSFPPLPSSPPLIHPDNDNDQQQKSTMANDDRRGEGEGSTVNADDNARQ